MKSSYARCATVLLSTAFMVVGSRFADATEFAVLRQRFDHNGVTFNSQTGGVATPVENLDISLNTAQAGTLQSVSSSLGIVNPDSNDVGTAATFDVFYTGAASDFPASSFFDVFTDFTQPGTNERSSAGVIRDSPLEPQQFWAVDLGTQLSPGPEYLFSLAGQINSLQPGLSFNGLNVVQGTSTDPNANSFFDIFTELQFSGPGTINPSLPLFEITMTGASVPEPSTLVLAAIAVVALMGVARRRLKLRAA